MNAQPELHVHGPCTRCGYTWSSSMSIPSICSKCKSRYWRVPRMTAEQRHAHTRRAAYLGGIARTSRLTPEQRSDLARLAYQGTARARRIKAGAK